MRLSVKVHVYMLSAKCRCMGKKLSDAWESWRMSRLVLFLCRKSSSISGLVRLVITMMRSPNVFLFRRFVEIGRRFVFFPEIVWSFGMISMSMTGIWLFVTLCCGLKFSYGEVWDSSGLTFHKSSNGYPKLFDTCESVILLSSSICSSD